MWKENRRKIILSSIIVLLPVLLGALLWERLPDTMTTHWGADGRADGNSGKAFVVFGMPLILLAVHLFCLWVTFRDNTKRGQSGKAMNLVFWPIPLTSLFASGVVYMEAFDRGFTWASLLPSLLGLMFAAYGSEPASATLL